MADFLFQYDISTDMPQGVNPSQLRSEINAEFSPSPVCTRVQTVGDKLNIFFDIDLTDPQQDTLDGDTTNPAGGLLGDHTPATPAIPAGAILYFDGSQWQTAPATASGNIARWNGATYESVPVEDILTGLSGLISSLAEDEDEDETPAVLQVRRTSDLNPSSSWSDVTFDTTDIENKPDILKHNDSNTERIDIFEDGFYEVKYHFGIMPDDATTDYRVQLNGAGAEIPGSLVSQQTNSNVSDINLRIAAGFIVELASGDYITFQAMDNGGNQSIEEPFTLTVKQLRSRGPRGEKGDQGEPGEVTVSGSLEDLPDTNIAAPASGQVLMYDGNFWTNRNDIFINVYEAGTTNIGSTPTTIDLDTIRVQSNDIAFSLSGGELTVLLPGIYEVSFGGNITTSSNSRSKMATWLELDTGEVPGTRRSTYHRNNSQNDMGMSATVALSIDAGSVLRIRSDHISGTSSGGDSIANTFSLYVRWIAPQP